VGLTVSISLFGTHEVQLRTHVLGQTAYHDLKPIVASGAGAILGSVVFGYLCDRYGRKKLYIATPMYESLLFRVSPSPPPSLYRLSRAVWSFLPSAQYILGGDGSQCVLLGVLRLRCNAFHHRRRVRCCSPFPAQRVLSLRLLD
jgi:hypothetical protein